MEKSNQKFYSSKPFANATEWELFYLKYCCSCKHFLVGKGDEGNYIGDEVLPDSCRLEFELTTGLYDKWPEDKILEDSKGKKFCTLFEEE